MSLVDSIIAPTETALLWLCGILLVLLLGSNAIWYVAETTTRFELAQAQTDLANLRSDNATQRARYEARARQREREQADAIRAITQIYEQELADANETHAAIVAGLDAGNLRLRAEWQGCVATADLSRSVAATVQADAADEFRRKGAADLVWIADECDARIAAFQRYAEIVSGAAP